mmetsp:Transcript_3978/g.9099  ORF Transcript_3978/g.9099 Transcript_3978/m.9099 type:complete len:86 (-) Transcript_3978:218-475(-)
MTYKAIIDAAKVKYNNLVSREFEDGTNAWTRSQAKGDKLMALTTQVQELRLDSSNLRTLSLSLSLFCLCLCLSVLRVHVMRSQYI